MSHFTSGGARWRPTARSVPDGAGGSLHPQRPRAGRRRPTIRAGACTWSTRTTSSCGSGGRRELLALEGEFERDRNRRLDIRTRKPITGLADGEFLVGVDFRPSNGLLYGVGRIGGDPMALGQLYTIDVDSGRRHRRSARGSFR